jgi:hypothetical protein
MGDDTTIDLYVIQNISKCADPKVEDRDNCEGYLENLQAYFCVGWPIIPQDIDDFIRQVTGRVEREGKIQNLIIGSHGRPGRDGWFRIGNTIIDSYSLADFEKLRRLRGFFAEGARVFIMACRVGQRLLLLQKVSTALGGVGVYGYTDYIWVNPFSVTYGFDKGGTQNVCYDTSCIDTNRLPTGRQYPPRKRLPLGPITFP